MGVSGYLPALPDSTQRLRAWLSLIRTSSVAQWHARRPVTLRLAPGNAELGSLPVAGIRLGASDSVTVSPSTVT
jgi:hypothetical protein